MRNVEKQNSIQNVIYLIKTIKELYIIVIIVTSIFHKDNKYYLEVSIGECFYKL